MASEYKYAGNVERLLVKYNIENSLPHSKGSGTKIQ